MKDSGLKDSVRAEWARKRKGAGRIQTTVSRFKSRTVLPAEENHVLRLLGIPKIRVNLVFKAGYGPEFDGQGSSSPIISSLDLKFEQNTSTLLNSQSSS